MEKLQRHERETIISFTESEDTASVFTYVRSWRTHMESVLGVKPVMVNGYGGAEYEIPKSWIRKPRRPRRREKDV